MSTMIDPSLIDDELTKARGHLNNDRTSLLTACSYIGMARNHGGAMPHDELAARLEQLIVTISRIAVLELVSGPLFYSALTRSAAEVESPPSISQPLT